MNLDIFRSVDGVIELYDRKKDIYKIIADEIKDFFENDILSHGKYTLTVAYRVKTADSLREKIIRNNYIGRYSDPEEMLSNVQDIIGIRLECKFIDDEHYAYELLKEEFSCTDDGEYFYTERTPRIKLCLGEKQPQKQKNGFDIYKIDGIYALGKENVRFELQIKAMVNLFWGEVEHKIMYKNNNFIAADEYVHDLMVSIKKSLNMIDSQMHLLYKRYKRSEVVGDDNRKSNIKKILSKMIYDIFAEQMNEQLGFTISFRNSCESIVEYIIRMRGAENMEQYGKIISDMFNKLEDLKKTGINFETCIEFESEICLQDEFSNSVANTALELVNTDYNWHLFFLILFSLEQEGNSESLKKIVEFYRNKLMENENMRRWHSGTENERAICSDILSYISKIIKVRRRINIVCVKGIRCTLNTINEIADSMTDDWEHEKEIQLKKIKDVLWEI